MVDNEIANLQYEDFNHDLNNYITQDEIKKAIKNLKYNKANGEDGIRNEYIKATQQLMLPVYEKLFKLVF